MTVLVGVAAFVAGVYFADKIKAKWAAFRAKVAEWKASINGT